MKMMTLGDASTAVDASASATASAASAAALCATIILRCVRPAAGHTQFFRDLEKR